MLPIPLVPAHLLARVAKRIRLPFPVSPEQVLRLAESKAVDIAAASRDLAFTPRSFETGIEAEVRALVSSRARSLGERRGKDPGSP